MLNTIPRHLPSLPDILSDLGNPSADAVGFILDVSGRTVQRWIADGTAPRSAMLALFWLTSWGRSAIDCAAVNDARLQAGLARALGDELKVSQAKIARLSRIADFGCSNDPMGDAFGPGSMASPLSQIPQAPPVSSLRVTIPIAGASPSLRSPQQPLARAHLR